MTIDFNRPYLTGQEFDYINKAIVNKHLSGDGEFTKKCQQWIEKLLNSPKALLTPSGTAALDLAALLIDFNPGDEVIMPSFTFPSTANAFVLRGATPVFIDIRKDTLNIDETLIEHAVTERTKAIVVVHYGGIGCDMNTIMSIANKHNLSVIEDAAHAIMASYDDTFLGSYGHLSAFSFHETKNLICGEGGALVINDPAFIERAEIIREKGTDRGRFLRGQVDKYSWVDLGSSLLPSELQAAYLWAQMEQAEDITNKRLKTWNMYHDKLLSLEQRGTIRRPIIPKEAQHNGHLYYLLAESLIERDNLITFLKEHDVYALFHYVPLHAAPAGRKFGKVGSSLKNTEEVSSCLLRLPMWIGLSEEDVDKVSDLIGKYISSVCATKFS